MAQPQVAVYNIDWGLYPKPEENPRALRVAIPLPGGSTITQVNIGNESAREQLSNTQTIFIDNSAGANAVSLKTSKSQFNPQIPAGSQGFLPWLWGDDVVLTVERSDAGTLPIYFINMPVPAIVWSSTAAGAVVTVAGGSITIAGPFGQEVMADSFPVTIASDQSPIPTTGTSADNKVDIEQVGGAPLALGQAVEADSIPVVIASDQTAVPGSVADGDDVAQGALADAAVTNPANPGSVIALLKGILTTLLAPFVVTGNTTPADGVTTPTTAVNTRSFLEFFNGTTSDRARNNSAANISRTTQPDALMVARPGQWTITNFAATGAAATVTKPAGAAGVRHVANLGSWTAVQNATTGQTGLIQLRDGATGVGTPLVNQRWGVPAGVGNQANTTLPNLEIFGSAATAMCIEFNAGVTDIYQSVLLTGYST